MLLSGKFVVFPLIYEQDCSSDINNIAYGGANLVPIAVPWSCLKKTLIVFKDIVFKNTFS